MTDAALRVTQGLCHSCQLWYTVSPCMLTPTHHQMQSGSPQQQAPADQQLLCASSSGLVIHHNRLQPCIISCDIPQRPQGYLLLPHKGIKLAQLQGGLQLKQQLGELLLQATHAAEAVSACPWLNGQRHSTHSQFR